MDVFGVTISTPAVQLCRVAREKTDGRWNIWRTVTRLRLNELTAVAPGAVRREATEKLRVAKATDCSCLLCAGRDANALSNRAGPTA
jgi:hypothetical protein